MENRSGRDVINSGGFFFCYETYDDRETNSDETITWGRKTKKLLQRGK